MNELATIWSEVFWIACFPKLVFREDLNYYCVSGEPGGWELGVCIGRDPNLSPECISSWSNFKFCPIECHSSVLLGCTCVFMSGLSDNLEAPGWGKDKFHKNVNEEMSVLLPTLNSKACIFYLLGTAVSSLQRWLLEILHIFVHTSCSSRHNVPVGICFSSP